MADLPDYDPEDYWDNYDPEEEAYLQRRAEEPPDWYFKEEAERQAQIHRDQEHGGGECDCPPYQPPKCRPLNRLPRWSRRKGWHCGTLDGCLAWGYPTPWAAWRAHQLFHEAPF